jgi:hypothetical protein
MDAGEGQKMKGPSRCELERPEGNEMNSNINNLKPDEAQVKAFLTALWPCQEDGFFAISTDGGRGHGLSSKFFSHPIKEDLLLNTLERWANFNAWFSIGLFKNRPQHGRGKASDVGGLSGVVADIDCQGGTHNETNLPTKEAALQFISEFPFKPSMVVWSGGGFQVYWLFSEPWIFEAAGDQGKASDISLRWQRYIVARGKEHGWKLDSVGSLEHLFRIPGTFNCKADPIPVEIIESNKFTYSVDSIESFLDDIPQEAHGAQDGRSSDGGHSHGDLEKILQSCEFMRHWRDHSAELTEPEWWCGICAIHPETGAEKAIHEYSKTYPDYTPKETNKKIQEAQKLTGPMSCKTIRDKTGFDGCPSGGCGVVYPVHLGGGPVQWESPILLDEYQAPVFDVELPGILGEMCKAVSAATETPIELAVGDCLATVATAIHGKVIVRVKPGYTEPTNIFIVSFLDPGNRKTSVMIVTTKPLTSWEAIKREAMAPMIKQLVSERASQEARIKSLRGKYGKAKVHELDEIQDEIFQIEQEMEEVPVLPKCWVQDITLEHLGTQMGIHGGKMSIISSEGGIFDIIGGRYNGGIPNLDLVLQGHAGDPVRVDRGSRDSIFIDSPALTMGLSPQPDVLRSIADQKGFRGRGLLARPLYFLPKSNLGNRTLETEPIQESITNKWEGLIHTLLDIEPQKDQDGQIEPFVIDLSRAAYSEWLVFAKMVEIEMREGGRFDSLTDWAGKLPGASARLAGLLHCVKHDSQPWAENISVETMQQALDLAAVFASHAEIAFEMMGADLAIEGAKKVWRWIEKGRHESFTRSDCFQALRGTFKRVADIEGPLNVLEERNYIAGGTVKGGPKGGRPSIIYSVNLEIIKGWS